MPQNEQFRNFVEHPIFGREPRFTGLNPQTDYGGDIFLHWHSPETCRIPNTAVAADFAEQLPATVPVTHYYDVIRTCRDCNQKFIFFADEQKFWYEDMKFRLESDCIRCVDCRKTKQRLALARQQYEELSHRDNRSVQETLTMAVCCLTLIEQSVFTVKQTSHVRQLLNSIAGYSRNDEQHSQLLERLLQIETQLNESN